MKKTNGVRAYRRGEHHHMWTKDEFRQLISLWDGNSTEDIAKQLGVSRTTVSGLAARMRKAGFDLPKKFHVGYLDSLLKELLAETKVPKAH